MKQQITPYKNVIVAGCGDIGRRVAQRWSAQGLETTGIVASNSSKKQLELQGIKVSQLDLDEPGHNLQLPLDAALVYYFVPPPAHGVSDTRVEHFLSVIDQQGTRPARIVAISTTGVYGDCGGEIVTEEKLPHPMVDRARRRYDMECRLKFWCEQHDVALVILRVGGIYGPDRLPLKRIREGIPVLHESLAPKTNRIHEDDLAEICVAAAKVNTKYRVYNVSDGTESNMTEYFFKLADHFKLPRPPAVDWQQAEQSISKGMLSYLKESRRVDNSRMLKELNIKLHYPDLDAGLKAIDPENISADNQH